MMKKTTRAAPTAQMTAVATAIVLLWASSLTSASMALDDDNVPLTFVQSVSGMLTNLPCNITPSVPGDKVNLVLWYKDGLGKPLYSFDLRGDMADPDGKIWASAEIIDGASSSSASVEKDSYYRAQLHTRSAPTAVLSLLGVTEGDAGSYRCRVDFKRSPTRYWKVVLQVIVPPSSSVILDEKGSVVQGDIGPFNELSTLILTCDVLGGWPHSRVTWWRNGVMIDSVYEEIAPGKSRNTMKVETLTRRDLGAEFTCFGNNNNDTQPVANTVRLKLNLRPVETRLIASELGAMTADVEYEVRCETAGAQPAAVISWWINGNIRLKDFINEVSHDGNVTTSVLKLRPTMQDHDQMLSCRAENPVLTNSVKDDSVRLEVYYPPVIALNLGSNLDETDIKEGDDVYFECDVTSNPEAYKVTWRRNGQELLPDARRGIMINERSLVIQRVDRAAAGAYVCQATNSAGTGASAEVALNVKYIPVCGRQGQGIGVGRDEEARVVCHVDGNPPPMEFFWQFNSTNEFRDVSEENVIVDGAVSVVSYVPRDESDYGTLLCWGRNELGRQRRPCVFHVIPAGKPDPVRECGVTNKTFTSIHVECAPGYDGGLQQSFVIEVFPVGAVDLGLEIGGADGGASLVSSLEDSVSGDPVAASASAATGLLANPVVVGGLASPIVRLENRHFPNFYVENLQSGTAFGMVVYAQNSKGESEKQVLRAFTLKNAARQVDNPELAKVGDKRGHLSGSDSEGFGPFFWVVLSVASVLVSASVVLALVIRTRCFMGRGSEAAASIRRPLGERRRPFENPKKKRRRSSASTMRFPRHEMEVGGRENSRPTSSGSPCNKTMSMSVSFRSGQTTETASLVSSNAAAAGDNGPNGPPWPVDHNGGCGTGSTTSPVDLTAKGLGLFPGPARNRGHSVCLEDEFAAGLGPHQSSSSSSSSLRQLHYTTLPRNTQMSKTSNGRMLMRLPLENGGGGHDTMMARNNSSGGPPNGIKPHLPPRPPLRTTEVTYAELTLPRMHHHGGHAGRSHPHPAAHAHLKPASDYSPPASTSTFKAITSPPPRGSHPLVTSPTATNGASGTMYAALGPRGTAVTSPSSGLIGSLPEEDETTPEEDHGAAAKGNGMGTPPVPPMFADPPHRRPRFPEQGLPLTSSNGREETARTELGLSTAAATASGLTRF